jgi:hypothetical protein
MKLVNLSLLACIMLLSCSSCNKKLAKDKQTNAVTMQGTPSDTMSPGAGPSDQNTGGTGNNDDKAGTYDLVLSFYSIGGGIDLEAKEGYDKFLEGYKGKITPEETRWGREGEVDYCLKLSALSEGEKKDFIAKSRKVLENSKLVHIYENHRCVHKK